MTAHAATVVEAGSRALAHASAAARDDPPAVRQVDRPPRADLAALAAGESTITLHAPGCRRAVDRRRAARARGAIGRATVGRIGLGPRSGVRRREAGRLGPGAADCGNSGTTMRLLAGALAGAAAVAATLDRRRLAQSADRWSASPSRCERWAPRSTPPTATRPLTIHGRRPLRAHPPPSCRSRAPRSSARSASRRLAADGTTDGHVPGPSATTPSGCSSALGAWSSATRASSPRSTGRLGSRRSTARARRLLVGGRLARRRRTPPGCRGHASTASG